MSLRCIPLSSAGRHLRIQSRHYGGSAATSKIYALPFKLSDEKARNLINVTASAYRRPLLQMFQWFISSFQSKTPTAVSQAENLNYRAAYLPTWYYDFAVSFRANMSTLATTIALPSSKQAANKTDQDLSVQPFRVCGIGMDCFWPGHAWDPLTYLSFGTPLKMQEEELVEWDEEKLKGDAEVIPFTVNPLEDVIGRLTPRWAAPRYWNSEDSKVSVDLWSLKVEFVAAYPVYWPIYLAEFDRPLGGQGETRQTIVLSGHRDDPFVCQWKGPEQQGVGQWSSSNGKWVNVDVSDQSMKLGNISFMPNSSKVPVLKQIEEALVRAIEKVEFGSGGNGEVDWVDKRIRPYKNEQRINKDYLEAFFEYEATTGFLKKLNAVEGSFPAMQVGKDGIKLQEVETVRDGVIEQIVKTKERMEKMIPEWWKDYKETEEAKK